ncbi:MAG: chromate transporter [Burkholderiaceae bacterium]
MSHFSSADWLTLFAHFLSLSLLAVGGAITTAPDMHRFLVDQRDWLSDPQFTASIALAQAAPGPNVLFIALMGWNVGLNSAGGVAAGPIAYWPALGGALLAMLGTMIPSATLTYFAAQWGHRNRHRMSVRAFKAGMAPIVIALLIATGWLITSAHDDPARDWRLWLLTAAAVLVVLRTRVHMLWLIGAGAVLGALGWV